MHHRIDPMVPFLLPHLVANHAQVQEPFHPSCTSSRPMIPAHISEPAYNTGTVLLSFPGWLFHNSRKTCVIRPDNADVGAGDIVPSDHTLIPNNAFNCIPGQQEA
jgi:hypothetical protein